MNAKRQTSPWIYIGCGCAVLIGLIAVAMVGAGYLGFAKFKGYIEEMEDPAAREARARDILGAETLPAGYQAEMFFGIPLLLDLVVLSGGEAVFEAIPGHESVLDDEGVRRIFFYLRLRRWNEERAELERFFDGTTDRLDRIGNADSGFRLRSRETIGRGAFELPPQQLRYVAQRGELRTQDEDNEGIYAALLIDCPGDNEMRFALWFLPEDEPPAEATPAALAGTPADEDALRAFMGHFQLCG